MRVLVTGGGGFLGSHIVMRLLENGYETSVFGRRDYPALAAKGVRCFKGDLGDFAAVRLAVEGHDAVIHSAALPGIWGKFEVYYHANVLGTINVLAAAREFGVKRLVYTSTPSVVHGGSGIEGGDETLPYPDHYLTPYAATKAEAEKKVIAANSQEFSVAAIRPHLIFGPGDRQLIPKLVERARQGRLIRVGGGTNLISVSYVENVAHAHVLALEHLGPAGTAHGQIYFINEPQPVNCWQFINRIVTGLGLPAIKRGIPACLAYGAGWLCEKIHGALDRSDDPRLTRFLVSQLSTSHWFKTTKAERQLGWKPLVDFDEGVEKMLAYMKTAQKA